ncbi:MAG TPA: phosphotransferase [Ktedonobacterales bacterium]|jgi:Ser/Thr protein kinase RdoA (MazF antagonist)|nr:phosphotransferase [Ktedonobacterales bacterium]
MMDVHRMRHIVDVAATGALPDVAHHAMRRWEGSSLAYVRSSANHVFRITLDGRPCYLRLTHTLERSREAIVAELDFVQHVSHAGVLVALPLPSAASSLIEEVEADGERYYAVVFEGLTGNEYDPEELDAAHYRTWGRMLARVHQASRAFPPTTARPTWQDVIRATRDALPAEERSLAQRLDTGLAWLQGLSLQPNDTGLLHGDCELDNLVWAEGRCQVLDFESAMYAPYTVDIAITLEDVWQTQDDRREHWIAAFCDGYREVSPLPIGFPDMSEPIRSLLLATKLARLMLAYRAYPRPVDAEHPSWLANMQARHSQWIATKRASLALESP